MSDTSDQTPLEPRAASDRSELRTSRLPDGNWIVASRPNETGPTTRRISGRADDEEV